MENIMEQKLAETMNRWRLSSQGHTGLKSAFWAGRLAYTAERLTNGSNILKLMSYNLALLDAVCREYDAAIVKESRPVTQINAAEGTFTSNRITKTLLSDSGKEKMDMFGADIYGESLARIRQLNLETNVVDAKLRKTKSDMYRIPTPPGGGRNVKDKQ